MSHADHEQGLPQARVARTLAKHDRVARTLAKHGLTIDQARHMKPIKVLILKGIGRKSMSVLFGDEWASLIPGPPPTPTKSRRTRQWGAVPWPPMAKTGNQCGRRDPDEGAVVCTRKRGHEGDHVAHSGDGATGKACDIICAWA